LWRPPAYSVFEVTYDDNILETAQETDIVPTEDQYEVLFAVTLSDIEMSF